MTVVRWGRGESGGAGSKLGLRSEFDFEESRRRGKAQVELLDALKLLKDPLEGTGEVQQNT